MKHSFRSLHGFALLALAAAFVPNTATAQDFKGNVKVIVAYAAGGGYDIYGRQLARHIGKHLPGKPNVIVQNMPGAGGVNALNYIYNQAPKDGTEFAIFARSMPIPPSPVRPSRCSSIRSS